MLKPSRVVKKSKWQSWNITLPQVYEIANREMMTGLQEKAN